MQRRNRIIRRAAEQLSQKQLALPGFKEDKPKLSKKIIRRAAINSAMKDITLNERATLFGRKEAVKISKALAELFAMREHFNGKRGFTSRELAFSHNPKNGSKIVGIDKSLYALMRLGISKRNISILVNELLAVSPKKFRAVGLTDRNYGTFAAKLFVEMRPEIKYLFPKKYNVDSEFAARIDHHLIFILSRNFLAEVNYKRQKKFTSKMFPPGTKVFSFSDKKKNRYRKEVNNNSN